MEINYTPIDNLVQSFRTKINVLRKKRINRLFVVSIIVLFLSASFFFYVILGRNTKEYDTSSPAAKVRDIIKEKVPQARILSGGFRFDSAEKINFIPKKIGNYTFVSEAQILEEAKTIYPDFATDDLKRLVVKLMTTWTTLRNLYSAGQSVEGVDLQPATGEISFLQIDHELPALEETYEKNKAVEGGFYLKVRFSGVFKENIEKLNLAENQLKDESQKILNSYMVKSKDFADPSLILDSFNADQKVSLLNNGEKSEAFENSDLDPPFFDDPDFYKMVANLAIGEFSPVYTLKTGNPNKSDMEEYAFVTFYLRDKKGQLLPLNELVRQFLIENRVR